MDKFGFADKKHGKNSKNAKPRYFNNNLAIKKHYDTSKHENEGFKSKPFVSKRNKPQKCIENSNVDEKNNLPENPNIYIDIEEFGTQQQRMERWISFLKNIKQTCK